MRCNYTTSPRGIATRAQSLINGNLRGCTVACRNTLLEGGGLKRRPSHRRATLMSTRQVSTVPNMRATRLRSILVGRNQRRRGRP
eukprot:11186612-Lingulodinium_polyedra.AAC.1